MKKVLFSVALAAAALTAGVVFSAPKEAKCYQCQKTGMSCYNSYQCGYGCSCYKKDFEVQGHCM